MLSSKFDKSWRKSQEHRALMLSLSSVQAVLLREYAMIKRRITGKMMDMIGEPP